MTDGLGNPVRLLLTEGNRHDITQAEALLAFCHDANVIADKGYDSNAVEKQLKRQNCTVVIPSRQCVNTPRVIDTSLYKERFLVENFFQKIKRKRRIATRYEKLAVTYLSMVLIASIVIWLM